VTPAGSGGPDRRRARVVTGSEALSPEPAPIVRPSPPPPAGKRLVSPDRQGHNAAVWLNPQADGARLDRPDGHGRRSSETMFGSAPTDTRRHADKGIWTCLSRINDPAAPIRLVNEWPCMRMPRSPTMSSKHCGPRREVQHEGVSEVGGWFRRADAGARDARIRSPLIPEII
jgi:hypothetical protein